MLKKVVFLFLLLSFFNCEDIIAVEDISEDTITVLAPVNNTVITPGPVTFSWYPVEFAEQYHLQIATPNFDVTQQIVEDTIVSTSDFTKTLDINNYQWRVKAVNFAYETPFTTQNLDVED